MSAIACLGAGALVYTTAVTSALWTEPFHEEEPEDDKEAQARQRRDELQTIAAQASWRRLAELFLTLLPVVLAWPLWLLSPSSFWALVAFRVDCCGPTFVKLAQWLSTRRDLFPDDACQAFAGMYNQVEARWSTGITSAQVRDVLEEHKVPVRAIESRAHASGSIAEVFFATLEDGTEVAVKCLRPGVKQRLEADLAWLLRFSELADRFPMLRLLGIRHAAEDFADHVRMQTDLQAEASHLLRFRRNFSDGTEAVRFPTPLHVMPEALVLTREVGLELSEIFKARREAADGICAADAEMSPEARRIVARQCMAAFMRMVFNDNFIHGDLHPGNLMLHIRPKVGADDACGLSGGGGGGGARELEGGGGFVERVSRALRRPMELFRKPEESGCELIILDAGLAIPLPKEKVEVLRSLAISIIYSDFARAAELLYEQSPDSSRCWDPVAFKAGLAQTFQDCRRNIWEEGCVQVSDACLRSLQLVQKYNVAVDVTLTWTLFGMLSIEGSARQLDPDVDCARAATRYIITLPSLAREMRGQSWNTIRHMLGELVCVKLGIDYWEWRRRFGWSYAELQG